MVYVASMMSNPVIWPAIKMVAKISEMVISTMPRPRNVAIMTLALCLTMTVSLSASKRGYLRLIRMPINSVTSGITITPIRTRMVSMIPN